MNRIIFLSICIFLFASISSSQQDERKFLEPVVKNGKWDYTDKQAQKKDMTNTRRDRREKNSEGDIPITTPKNRPLTHSEEVTLHAVIQDFQVNENVGRGCNAQSPTIAIDGSGNFIITWTDRRNNWADIYAQIYNDSGVAQGKNFKVNDDNGKNHAQYSSAIAIDASGNIVITWMDGPTNNIDICAQIYNSSGVSQGKCFQVNDDTGNSNQSAPSIAIDGSGNFVITWRDERNDDSGDIYAQIYNNSGIAQGKNFKVNEGIEPWSQGCPAIAVDSRGNFVIIWLDSRNSGTLFGSDIYAQMYNSSGVAQGNNFKVNDDIEPWDQGSPPSIAMDGLGNFVIAWHDNRNGTSDIYAQGYNSSGVAQGNNFKVNDDTGNSYQSSPSIAIDGSGNFVITWNDRRNGAYDIYAQRYNSSGVAQGTNFKVNDDTGNSHQSSPSIAVDESGNFVIAWEDNRNGTSDIYAQGYNSSGVAQGTNFKVNDDTGNSYQFFPSIAIDGPGNFVVAWEDERNDADDIYAQRYNGSGTTIGINFRVTAVGNKEQFSPDVRLWNNGIYTTWVSNHSEATGDDIWANALDWHNPTRVEEPVIGNSLAVNGHQLGQNYPNPFNSETTIIFAIPKDEYTTMNIYDMRGRLVKTVVSEHKTAGHYSTKWNGTNEKGELVASGLYLYQMKSGEYSRTKRILLLK